MLGPNASIALVIAFPTIFTLGLAELGPLTGSGSGILNMAIVGGAILPLIQGVIADHIGLHHAFFVPVVAICTFCSTG
jgi:FHS family L-fucose permease-like MFS transporter